METQETENTTEEQNELKPGMTMQEIVEAEKDDNADLIPGKYLHGAIPVKKVTLYQSVRLHDGREHHTVEAEGTETVKSNRGGEIKDAKIAFLDDKIFIFSKEFAKEKGAKHVSIVGLHNVRNFEIDLDNFKESKYKDVFKNQDLSIKRLKKEALKADYDKKVEAIKIECSNYAAEQIRQFLDQNNVEYDSRSYDTAYLQKTLIEYKIHLLNKELGRE